jgi:hypothetical protein
MTKLFRDLLWILLLPAGALLAQEASNAEKSSMELYASLLGLYSNVHNTTLQTPEGSKGYSMGVPESTRLPRGFSFVGGKAISNQNASLSDADYALQQRVCGSAAIVVGKEVGSSVAITDNKTLIYTKHRVQVVRVLREDASLAENQSIEIAQPGGTIFDEGEKVSLGFPHLIPVVPGETYLYFLVHLQGAPANLFVPGLSREDDNIRVSSDRILLGDQTHENFVNGESIEAIEAHLKKILAEAPCTKK